MPVEVFNVNPAGKAGETLYVAETETVGVSGVISVPTVNVFGDVYRSGNLTPSSAMLLIVTRLPADAVMFGPVKRNLILKFGLSFTAAIAVKSD